MDHLRFDALVMRLGETPRARRAALRLVAGAALAGLFARASMAVPAAEAAGCLKVAKPCRRASQCCSGICRGARGKKTCRGHGAGTCKQQGQTVICTAQDIILARCDNDKDCYCATTTAGTTYCYDFNGSDCAVCERDADCVALGFPPGSACAPWTAGRCAGNCESGSACLVRCGVEPPPPEADDLSRSDTTPLGPLGGNR